MTRPERRKKRRGGKGSIGLVTNIFLIRINRVQRSQEEREKKKKKGRECEGRAQKAALYLSTAFRRKGEKKGKKRGSCAETKRPLSIMLLSFRGWPGKEKKKKRKEKDLRPTRGGEGAPLFCFLTTRRGPRILLWSKKGGKKRKERKRKGRGRRRGCARRSFHNAATGGKGGKKKGKRGREKGASGLEEGPLSSRGEGRRRIRGKKRGKEEEKVARRRI